MYFCLQKLKYLIKDSYAPFIQEIIGLQLKNTLILCNGLFQKKFALPP